MDDVKLWLKHLRESSRAQPVTTGKQLWGNRDLAKQLALLYTDSVTSLEFSLKRTQPMQKPPSDPREFCVVCNNSSKRSSLCACASCTYHLTMQAVFFPESCGGRECLEIKHCLPPVLWWDVECHPAFQWHLLQKQWCNFNRVKWLYGQAQKTLKNGNFDITENFAVMDMGLKEQSHLNTLFLRG